ncbi:uncharacterized protein LOC124350084 [Daphnia pulicaria]|uniref:uncharacterized protein LOC124350084 n=1 Tax=Daphnia pulicaria TaxID=35523 RepID=UPI001EE9D0DB|nr:uncharacterized protein LOC124350084 [Daphnia pulicaria]
MLEESKQEENMLVVNKLEPCTPEPCRPLRNKTEPCMQGPWVCIRILDCQLPPQRQPRSKRRSSSWTSGRQNFEETKKWRSETRSESEEGERWKANSLKMLEHTNAESIYTAPFCLHLEWNTAARLKTQDLIVDVSGLWWLSVLRETISKNPEYAAQCKRLGANGVQNR